MFKNNGKMIIGRNFLFCLCVACLILTSFGLTVENSYAVELNETVDEIGLESDNMDKLENSQDEILEEVESQDSQEVVGATIRPSGNTFQSIKDAVNSANPGDTIKLSGTYYSSGDDMINIKKKLTITADTMATLDGKNLGIPFYISSDGAGTVFNNLKFINGNGNSASAMFIHAKNVQVKNCIFEDNHANKGGAICTKYDLDIASGVIIDNCQFRRNTAYFKDLENSSNAGAAAIYGKDSEIKNCIFEDNWAKSKVACFGGAIQVGLDLPGSNGKVSNCIFKNNRAISTEGESHGGAGCVRDGTIYVNCIFINNRADQGGALTFHASGEIKNCTFINNSAKNYGGALSTGFLYDYMEMSVVDCNFDGNTAPLGGAIQVKGTHVSIDDSTFKNNRVTEYGGAVNIEAEDVIIKNSVFTSNIANVNGGAVYINGKDTTIRDSSFNSNEAIPDVNKRNDGLGGAIYVNSSRASISDNSFRLNTARNGSAIYYDESGEKLTLNNNEFFQNQAWVYGLPISAKNIYYGESEKIKVVLYGGNNIADCDNIAVSNAIYNAARNVNIFVNDQYPINGATNTGDLYQDSREYNINVLLTVKHEDGTVVYDSIGATNYLGEININLDNLKAGKYYVTAQHSEDTYYKAITNTTTFTVSPRVDNEIRKEVSNSTPNFEDIVTWTITVKNYGPSNSTNVIVSDVLPNGLVWISDTSKGKYNHNTGKLTLDNLKVGETFTFDIKTVVTATGVIVNRANVVSDESDVDTSNNNAEKSITVNPASDLSVTKTASNTNPNYNDHITWTIEVTNNGPDVAHNVKISDLLPETLIYVNSDKNYNAKTGIWEIGTLNVNAKARLNIECIVNTAGFIENSVVVSASEFDYDLTNNNDTERIYVNPASDLAIDKDANASSINFGDIVKWILTITNNGPDRATNLCVRDVLPEGFAYINSTLNYNNGVFAIDGLDVGKSIVVEINTLAETTGTIVNRANVTSDNYDFNLTNNMDEKSIFVNPACDLSVSKTVSDETPNNGDIVTWTIEVLNNGPDVAHEVVVCDLLPSSLIWVGDDSQGRYDPKTGLFVIDELGCGASYVLNIDTMINGTDSIQNHVSVTAREYDYNLTNFESNVTIDVGKSSDLSIVKSVNNSSPNYGDLVKWILVISNNGPDEATNVRVMDILPKGLSYVNSTLSCDNGIFTIDSLDVGKNVTIEITALVEITGDIVNYANVTSDNYDFDLTNNEDNESVLVNPACDLSVTKTVNESSPNFNDVVRWTIVVLNRGPDVAHDVVVCDLLPSSLIWVGDDSQGRYDPKTGLFVIDELDCGASYVLNIDTMINRTDSIQNHVSVTAREYDYNLTDIESNVTISVEKSSDLSIVKSVNNSSPKYGDLVKWTLIISNNGPDEATNVRVMDILPKGFKYINSTLDYNNNTFTVDSLDVGKNITIKITTMVEITGDIVNYANVTSDIHDFDLTNNEDNESVFVSPACDLSVTKTVNESSPNFNDIVTWTIVVLNRGPDAAHEVVVCDLLPDSLIWVGDDSQGRYDPKTGLFVIDELDCGASYVLNIDTMINSTDSIQNHVSVTAREYDYNLTDIESNVTVSIEKSADVSIVKMVNNSSPNYEDLVKWTVIISNNGPDKATNVYVEDQLPEGLIFINYTATKGIYDEGIWAMCCLNNSETASLEIVCKVNKTGQIVNFASVTADEHDKDKSNNNANQSINVPVAVDLCVEIAVNNSNPLFGELVNWMITVKNIGPDNATEVVLQDVLPTRALRLKSSSGNNLFEGKLHSIGSLNVGDTMYLNITTVADTLGTISNKISVSSREFDVNMSNNYANDLINVKPGADVSITKLVDNDSPDYGETVKWTLIVANNGPNDATNVVVEDVLPEGLKFISSNGDYKNNVWNVGNLDVNETKTLEILCRVTSTGNFVNKANVHADENDPDESNNVAEKSISVTPTSDLSIVKLVDNDSPEYGQTVKWTLVITNNGPNRATGVRVVDVLPEGLKFVSSNGNYNKNTWKVGSLDVGETKKLVIVCKVTSTGNFVNIAKVSANEIDPDKSNNRAEKSIFVKLASDLSITKTVSKYHYKIGDVIEYEIRVVNNGPDSAKNIRVKEILDDLLKLKSFKVSKGRFDVSANLWTIERLGNGESAKLIIKVIAVGPGVVKNTVLVTSDTFDPDKSNNKDVAVVEVVKKAENKHPTTPKNNINEKIPTNLEIHQTANPIVMLVISILFSMILLGDKILKKR